MDAKVQAAAESLEITLEDWPTAEAVLQLLEERREWKPLERAYRRLLRETTSPRFSGGRDLELWRRLGGVYRDGLNDDASAIECYELLTKRDPPDVGDFLELATLHERNRRAVAAIEVLDRCLEVLPERLETYPRLYDLHASIGNVDGAWRAAGALTLLGHHDVEISNFFLDHHPREPRLFERPPLREDYELLRHRDLYPHISAMMSLLALPRLAAPKQEWPTPKTYEEIYRFSQHTMTNVLFPELSVATQPLSTAQEAALALFWMKTPSFRPSEESIENVSLLRAAFEISRDEGHQDEVARAMEALSRMESSAQVAKWHRAARATVMRGALLLILDPNLIADEFKDGETRVLAASSFACSAFGRLRASIGLGLTPPA